MDRRKVLQEIRQMRFFRTLQERLPKELKLEKIVTIERTHQGKMCCGRTPMDTLVDGKQIWKEKVFN